MCKRLLLTFVFLFSINNSSMAGVLLEPYLGFSLIGDGDSKVTNIDQDHSYSAITLGGRVGYTFLGFMGGLDYSYETHDIKSKSSVETAKDGINRNQLGLFVGYNLPILVRVWGTYFIHAGVEGKDNVSESSQFLSKDNKLESGSGIALGAGFTGLPFVSINLEYRKFDFDKLTTKGVTDNSYKGTSLSEFLLSVSLPLDI